MWSRALFVVLLTAATAYITYREFYSANALTAMALGLLWMAVVRELFKFYESKSDS
ncbi:MAG TPA: hypothetical protein VFX96_01940 [Pyrinomonadaceae bacterium]|nr:hypothetical protein [Pyrinomonadaceae bacterium]